MKITLVTKVSSEFVYNQKMIWRLLLLIYLILEFRASIGHTTHTSSYRYF